MGFLTGIFFITMGVIQISMRGRVARAQAGSNDAAVNELALRPAFQRFTTRVILVAGVFWTALGLLTIATLAAYGG